MGPKWGPPGSCRPQMGPMLAPRNLLSGTWPIFMSRNNRKFKYIFLFSKMTSASQVSIILPVVHLPGYIPLLRSHQPTCTIHPSLHTHSPPLPYSLSHQSLYDLRGHCPSPRESHHTYRLSPIKPQHDEGMSWQTFLHDWLSVQTINWSALMQGRYFTEMLKLKSHENSFCHLCLQSGGCHKHAVLPV